MNKQELMFAPTSSTSSEDLVKPSTQEVNPRFEKLTDDQLTLIGGGEGAVCW